MKKLNVFFATMVMTLVFAIQAKAQVTNDYYVGKWSVNVGVPGGDKKMDVVLTEKDGKLTGNILDAATGKVSAPITKVEKDAETATIYFAMSGTNVYMTMEKKDDKTFTGSMLDMFDCTGVKTESK